MLYQLVMSNSCDNKTSDAITRLAHRPARACRARLSTLQLGGVWRCDPNHPPYCTFIRSI